MKNVLTTGMVSVLSVFLIVLSGLLLFVPQMKAVYLCYIFCAGAVILGIYLIVSYFLRDAYKNMDEYGFSSGIFMVVLGICGMVKADELAGLFFVCLGILMIFSCVIKIQYVLDLTRMKDKSWVFWLILTGIVMIGGIIMILRLIPQKETYEIFGSYTVLADGVISLIMIIYLSVRLKIQKKKEEKVPEMAETKVEESVQTEEGMIE